MSCHNLCRDEAETAGVTVVDELEAAVPIEVGEVNRSTVHYQPQLRFLRSERAARRVELLRHECVCRKRFVQCPGNPH